MQESSDGNRKTKMLSALYWHNQIRVIAGPMMEGDTRESWLARAARKAEITYRQCKAIYYGETKDPKVSVALGVLRAAEKARKEARDLASRFESLAGQMHAANADLASDEVAALIQAAQRLRGLSSA